jgi:hypothetical protein
VFKGLVPKRRGDKSPPMTLSRNLGLLKEIKEATDVKLKIMVNEAAFKFSSENSILYTSSIAPRKLVLQF